MAKNKEKNVHLMIRHYWCKSRCPFWKFNTQQTFRAHKKISNKISWSYSKCDQGSKISKLVSRAHCLHFCQCWSHHWEPRAQLVQLLFFHSTFQKEKHSLLSDTKVTFYVFLRYDLLSSKQLPRKRWRAYFLTWLWRSWDGLIILKLIKIIWRHKALKNWLWYAAMAICWTQSHYTLFFLFGFFQRILYFDNKSALN